MKNYIRLAQFILCILPCINLLSQKNIGYKFEHVTLNDFNAKVLQTDSAANAIVLADVGSTEFEGNTNGYFTLIYKQHERILLKNRKAFDDATIKVQLYNYVTSNTEKFEELEASTFTLVNGQVIETKLDKASLFKEKENKYFISYKFTMPNLSEGCIIDYKFVIKSPFQTNNIRAWSFQGKYPVLWSEYKVTIPPFFNYLTTKQGYLPFTIDTSGSNFKTYSIIDGGDATTSSTVYSLSGDAKWAWWIMKDVPAFKEESYLTSPSNYISKIKFELYSIRYSDTYFKQIVKDWFTTAKELMDDEDFGKTLGEDNSWMQEGLKAISNDSDDLQKAKKIFAYVRDNFICTDHDEKYLSQTIRKTYQTKKGNVADLNLLLTAMLLHAGFDAHPVLLSTRENGYPIETRSNLSQFNYVVTRLKIDSTYYMLDGSVNRIGFGKLPKECYNASGRLIDKLPILINMSADSLSEKKYTFVQISNDEKDGLTGIYSSNLGYYESLGMRDKIATTKKEDIIKKIKNSFPADYDFSNIQIDSLQLYDEPVNISADLKIKFDEDLVYFNPIITDVWKNNPFAASERVYPVEMPYTLNEIYTLNMDVPKGYEIDELPKSTRVKLNENQGTFEYLLSFNKAKGHIQMFCKLELNKANFLPEDYQTLRDFFGFVVKKESEQFVFKKKKQL